MSTWRRGRELLFQRLQEQALPLDSFIENLETYPPTRVQGTAVFLNSATLACRMRCCTTSSTTRCCTSALC